MYSENDFRNYELYHHGVLGQKWGVRNGKNYPLDPSEHSASEKKAGWRKSLEIQKEGRKELKARTKGKFMTNYEYNAVRNEVQSKVESKLAKNAKTYLGRKIHEARSANAKYAAEYNRKKEEQYDIDKHGVKGVLKQGLKDSFIDKDAWNMPYQSISGRQSTLGKEIIGNYLTMGLYGAAKDAKYLHDKKVEEEPKSSVPSKKDLKNDLKEQHKKIQAEYDSELANIEKNYKRGQDLSDNDMAKEKAASDKYNKSWDNANRNYKKALEDRKLGDRAELTVNKSDSSVTKKVKKDYNEMTNDEFSKKYKTSKKTYADRVEKYGDPYMNSPAAKMGKALAKAQKENGGKLTAGTVIKTVRDEKKKR